MHIRNKNKTSVTAGESRLPGYFFSETVFSLSNRVLSDAKIRILEKGLDYTLIQRKINEPELRHDLNDFAEVCALNGTFMMNLMYFAKHLHLDLSQHGSLPKSILVWKFSESGRDGIV